MSVDSLIHSISTFRRRSPVNFGYASPFVLVYGLWFFIWAVVLSIDEYWQLGFIVTTVIVLLQFLMFKYSYWFVEVNCVLTCSSVPNATQASLAKVVPQPNHGRTELVPINRTKLPDGTIRIWLSFQKVIYTYNTDKHSFEALLFDTRLPFQHFYEHKGFESDQALKERALVYGDNDITMSIPKFTELFIKRSTAPFFVFQMICSYLFYQGDVMYFSLFTLIMIGTLDLWSVYHNHESQNEFKYIGNQSFDVYVYRSRRWNRVPSSTLVVGDIISICRPSDEKTVPCDLLLIRGQCIVDESKLNGVCVPQKKESVGEIDRRRDFDFNSDGRLHVIYGGTKIVQHTAPDESDTKMTSPDDGCICYVLRTGFNTSQGQLLRTILFGEKRVTANKLEPWAFLHFLMIFAAAYAWDKTTEIEVQNRYRLLLDLCLIPLNLSAFSFFLTTYSVFCLRALFVFCTDPFRILRAGKVNICCFDKTGTLTKNIMVVEGIAGLDAEGNTNQPENDQIEVIQSAQDAHLSSIQVLAACQSLTQCGEELIGDPLEKACLSWIDWNLGQDESVISKKAQMASLKIFRRYHFSSQLKRMTVIAGYDQSGFSDLKHLVVVKGAPETLKPMFASPPSSYDQTYQRLAQTGARVLALGIREFSTLTEQELRTMKREDYETDLEFAGFVVISCPLKQHVETVILKLIESSQHVTMITGDNPLTACHVASVLHFTKKNSDTLILNEPNGMSRTDWTWNAVEGELVELPILLREQALNDYELCLTGVGYDYLAETHESFLNSIIAKVRVFARMSPEQKESVIVRLKSLGYVTLMCGDGTNDVGALKQADVGVALISMPYDTSEAFIAEKLDKGKEAKLKEQVEDQQSDPKRPKTIAETEAQYYEWLKQFSWLSVLIHRYADAPISAPLTFKFVSIESICHVINQGRWLSVVTGQMFKILALNALVLASSQILLYAGGVKFTDLQATIQRLLLAVCFVFVCKSEPLKSLSKRPPSIFNVYTVLTCVLQFVVHLVCLSVVSERMHAIEPRSEKFDLAVEFKANLLNSAIFVTSTALQMCTIAVNYRGWPIVKSWMENERLLCPILSTGVVILAIGWNTTPDKFWNILVRCVVGDLLICFAIDRLLNLIFGEKADEPTTVIETPVCSRESLFKVEHEQIPPPVCEPRRSPVSIERDVDSPPRCRQRIILRSQCYIPRPVVADFLSCVDLHKRYPNLYIPSDFIRCEMSWKKSFNLKDPIVFAPNTAEFHILHKDVDYPLAEGESQLSSDLPDDADLRYTVKVLLLTHPGAANIRHKVTGLMADGTIDEQCDAQSLLKVLHLLVGKRGKNEVLGIGGQWSPSLDGADPLDPQTQINTAVRTTRAMTGLDLSKCPKWYKMVHLRYYRAEWERWDHVVLLLPDINATPNLVPVGDSYRLLVKETFPQQLKHKLDAIDAEPFVPQSEAAKKVKAAKAEEIEKAVVESNAEDKVEESMVTVVNGQLKTDEQKAEMLVTKQPKTIRFAASALTREEEDEYEKEMDKFEKSKKERKTALERHYVLPKNPCVLVFPSKTAEGGKFDCRLASGQSLLDYQVDDNKESSFEVFVFAEAIRELFDREFAFNVYHLLHGVPEKEAEDKRRDEALVKVEAPVNEEAEMELTEDETAESEVDEETDESEAEEQKDPRLVFTAVVHDVNAFMAFTHFDQNFCGYLVDRDLEEIVHSVGLDLSHSLVLHLLKKISAFGRFDYRNVTDKWIDKDGNVKYTPQVESDTPSRAHLLKPNEKTVAPTLNVQQTGSTRDVSSSGVVFYKEVGLNVEQSLQQHKVVEAERADALLKVQQLEQQLKSTKDERDHSEKERKRLETDVDEYEKRPYKVEKSLKTSQDDTVQMKSSLAELKKYGEQEIGIVNELMPPSKNKEERESLKLESSTDGKEVANGSKSKKPNGSSVEKAADGENGTSTGNGEVNLMVTAE